jgi:alpha-glucosidase
MRGDERRVNEMAAQELARTETRDWWRGAAIYQIYPRSFADSDGDGIGDLPGITAKLDYVASLGVEAIWISPFYTSPMRDFGYDVAEYCNVDPVFGTLADFDALVARAHGLGLKVIIDQVYAHSSDRHEWFVESRESRQNPKADWYVWADARPDGSPPTNWQSVFGGPAWTWDARRGQYYMHNFLKEQPQLNLHNPDVQEALLGVARFWLDRGVDGFRIDALNFAMHDPELRDNPPAPDQGKARTRPFDFQLKLRNQSHPDIARFVERIRALTDEYEAIFTMAEIGGDNSDAEMKEYTAGDRRLNSAYGFDFLYAPALTPELVCRTLAQWPAEPGVGWPSWAFENHDAPRAISRWCKEGDVEAFLRLKLALMAALRGNVILYQGEELGLEQDEIPFELLQDPEAIANWPLTLSRDGVRTPLPWQADVPHGGFTHGTPWLPLGERNLARAIDRQEGDPGSLLHLTRELLALRKSEPALRLGGAECRADGTLLDLRRSHGGDHLRCLFNLGERPIELNPPARGHVLHAVNGATPAGLPPFAAIFLKE